MSQNLGTLDKSSAPAGRHSHVARFYDDDSSLSVALASFVREAARAGIPALLIATAAHREALESELKRQGIDVTGSAAGEYTVLDAEDALAQLLRGGKIDDDAFRDVIGSAVEASSKDGRLYAFGELVALLWQRGYVAGAIRLEELWNDLLAGREIHLLCGYPTRNFETYPDPEGFEAICRQHTDLIPPERYSEEDLLDGGFSRVAALEQTLRTDRLQSESLRMKQAQLEDALRRVEDLERMRREFVAMAVHDIRGPAAVVTGFLEVLRKNLTKFDEASARAIIDKSLQQTHQIQGLVNDMLTIAEIDSVGFAYQIEPFDIRGAINEAVDAALQIHDGANIQVRVPPMHTALGDRRRQVQVLSNLLSNAIRFSPMGSPVVVEASERPREIIVTISDEGVGVPTEDIPKLFKPFVRLRPTGFERVKGTGLGLYICKTLVEGQGGTIGMDSAPGRGATVWYTLPRV